MSQPHATAGFAHPRRNVNSFGLQHGMHVADFGSGSGAYVFEIAELLENTGHVYAIDIQKDLLRRIHNEAQRRGFTNVGILWGDIEAPHGSKIADGTLDFVLISNLLFQVTDTEAVLKEAHRVLRSRGHLAIIDWSESFGGLGPTKEHVVTKDEAHAAALGAGFAFVREFEAGAHHYGLMFRHTNQKKVAVRHARA